MENLVEWLDDAANAAHEERATVAGYKLFIAGLNSTTHRTNGAIEDHLTLPLYSIAEGLAYCWWNIFGGRDSPVSLTKFRMGYAVPDVRLAFDGQAFEISSNAFSYENPELYFFAGGRESLARSDAESQLSEFIEKRGKANAFDLRYSDTVDPTGAPWERCSKVLARRDIVERLSRGW